MSSYRAAAGSALQSRVVQLCVIALIALDLGVATVALLGTAAAAAELPSAVVLAARWAPLALRVLLDREEKVRGGRVLLSQCPAGPRIIMTHFLEAAARPHTRE